MTNIIARELDNQGNVVYTEMVERKRVATPEEKANDEQYVQALVGKRNSQLEHVEDLESQLNDAREELSEIEEELEVFGIYLSEDEEDSEE